MANPLNQELGDACVRTSRANLEDQGVFLFVCPCGVGKTETALALAEILYGGGASTRRPTRSPA